MFGRIHRTPPGGGRRGVGESHRSRPGRWLAFARPAGQRGRSPHWESVSLTRCDRWRGVRKSPISIRVDALVLVFLFLFVPTTFVVESARAQDQHGRKVHRIGYLRVGPPPSTWVEALQQGFRERGYIDGQNVILDVRLGTSVDQLRPLADELVL